MIWNLLSKQPRHTEHISSAGRWLIPSQRRSDQVLIRDIIFSRLLFLYYKSFFIGLWYWGLRKYISHILGIGILASKHKSCAVGYNPIVSEAPYWLAWHSVRRNHGNRCLIAHMRLRGTVGIRGVPQEKWASWWCWLSDDKISPFLSRNGRNTLFLILIRSHASRELVIDGLWPAPISQRALYCCWEGYKFSLSGRMTTEVSKVLSRKIRSSIQT